MLSMLDLTDTPVQVQPPMPTDSKNPRGIYEINPVAKSLPGHDCFVSCPENYTVHDFPPRRLGETWRRLDDSTMKTFGLGFATNRPQSFQAITSKGERE